jgi:transcriptional regulator with XRE-family HTH domain
MTLGDGIRVKRIEKGLLQAEMAEKLGVSRFQVGRWERNLAKPSESELAVLVNILGVAGQMAIGRPTAV